MRFRKIEEYAWSVPGNDNLFVSMAHCPNDSYRSSFFIRKPLSSCEVDWMFSFSGNNERESFEKMMGYSMAMRESFLRMYDSFQEDSIPVVEGKGKFIYKKHGYDFTYHTVKGACALFSFMNENISNAIIEVVHYRSDDASYFTGYVGTVSCLNKRGEKVEFFHSVPKFIKSEAVNELKNSILGLCVIFNRFQIGSWNSLLMGENPEFLMCSEPNSTFFLKRVEQNEKS